MLSRSKAKIALKPVAAFALHWFDRLAVLGCRHATTEAKVLIVRLDAIGDFVLWLDAARSTIAYYRQQGFQVTLLANAAWAPWAESLQLADTLWALQPARFIRNLRYRALWLRCVRRAGFRTVVCPTFSREMVTGDSIARASRAPHRIASRGDGTNIGPRLKKIADSWYTQLIPAEPGLQMELRRHAEFLSGLTGHQVCVRAPVLAPRQPRPAFIPNPPYAVLFPSASWVGRMWPTARFSELAERLCARGLAVVIAGGPQDATFSAPIVAALQGKVIDMVGRTSLQDLAELLRYARLVVSNETSAVHIAAAVQAPTVCILGGGHFGRFAPYDFGTNQRPPRTPLVVFGKLPCFGCNWTCIHSRSADQPVLCIDQISIEQVWTAALHLLQDD